MFRHIQQIKAGNLPDGLELYGFTGDGRVFRAFAVDDQPDLFAAAAQDLETQAAEGRSPYSTISEYQLRCLRDSQEIKLAEILEELSHSSSRLPSLAVDLAA